ncbi:hypothetical protein MLD63_06445 [Paracoccus sp. TK19116]|uniref:Uncharacterized protein n=1 Tax=Paracoccus albicereus TaxID=2922394 RepID=A0ABT1MP46_9RHOB|nr:hypothetical protein [Paracoccus albicereus]MCQ0970065.1 hypothetical protein [Paracoccus albicereus]
MSTAFAPAAALSPGQALRFWTVSAISEERFDTLDQPLHGEMDPFFFLTKDQNFIPHEYPCRTEFAARYRDREPAPWGDATQARNWLPFGQDFLDLSGFWFRPTRIAAHATGGVIAAEPGRARLRLVTCGGAVMRINGAQVAWCAPYIRNYATAMEFEAELVAGENRIEVFFDDLAERDTRFFIRLDWLEGPEVQAALPFPGIPGETVRHVESMLDQVHFDRPAYAGGAVSLVWPIAPQADADLSIRVEGDFMSHERMDRRLALPAGSERLVLGQAEDFPADFRHFHVTLTTQGFTATRTLGVEIAHPAGPAPTESRARQDEALRAVAEKAEPDTVCALARLACGLPADDMILRVLPTIEECWDCADFALVPLLWSRMRFADGLAPDTLPRIDETILAYRYWMDEPGNDVQWYFSENHALLFHTAAYLAGHLLPDATFRRSGRSGVDQSAVGRDRVRAWLDHFEEAEMAEFNSAPYFPIDLKGLCALFALAPDADIRDRAGCGIARLVEIVANSAHQGVLTAAQGRSYEHTLRAGATLELSAIARMLWGAGSYGARFHCVPQLALCLRDHGLALPDLRARAVWDHDDGQEWCFTQGEGRFAHLYHWKTRGTAMGSTARYRWGEWGYQETLIHARIGTDPQAQVWINHPGELIQSGYGRPSYWGGSASIPRVQQYRGLAIVVFDGVAPQPDLTHAWFPASVFDDWLLEDATAAAAQAGSGLLISAATPLTRVMSGPSAGCELRQSGRDGSWIIRLADGIDSAQAMRDRFGGLKLTTAEDGTILVSDPDYGPVAFHVDGTVTAQGRKLDPDDWTLAGERRTLAPAADRTP